MRVDDLFNPIDVILLARLGFGIVAVHIAEDAVADADVLVGVDAKFGEDGFAFFRLKDFLGAVDPAGAEAFGVGGVEQVAHDKRTVFFPGEGSRGVGQNNENDGCTIERIHVVVGTKDGTIKFAQPIAHFAVGDGNDDGGLLVHARGGVSACLADFFNDLARRNFVGVAADAATRQQVLHGGVHGGFVFVFFLGVCFLLAATANEQCKSGENNDAFLHIKVI